MWLRTVMNVQMAKGGTMVATIKDLYKTGGVPRFYRGLAPALVQSPISRFGDTFANAGALAVCAGLPQTQNIPIALQTAFGSVLAGGMRIFLMPIDAWKTNKQVHGKSGLKGLINKAKSFPNRGPMNLYGWSSMYHGGVAAATATAVGNMPWFTVYNYCNANLGWDSPDTPYLQKAVRNASIGLAASVVSDTMSNSIRVLKTYRQTSPVPVSYTQCFNEIRAKDGLLGWEGLMFRGLQTRLVAHGANSAVFTVAFKAFQDMTKDEDDE